MRKDMSRKVIERPRVKGQGNLAVRRERRRTDYADMPHHESMRKTHKKRYDEKSLSDNLAPLYRFLDKQIGRPWNKVQSEMMQVLDTRDHIQAHIFEHVDSHIAINCQTAPLHESETGLVYHGQWSKWWDSRRRVYPNQLYVCPTSGIIKRAKSKVKKPKVTKQNNIRRLDDYNFAVKDNGVWYRIEIGEYFLVKTWVWFTTEENRTPEREGRSDCGYYHDYYKVDGKIIGRFSRYGITMIRDFKENYGHLFTDWRGYAKMFGNRKMHIINKHTMNRTELRKNNLKND